MEKVITANNNTVRDAVKRIFPDRHIHEFRYTFITRAKECGVNPEVVMLWSGHEFDNDVKTSRVDRGYTTYSDEYLLLEINKIRFYNKCWGMRKYLNIFFVKEHKKRNIKRKNPL